MLLLLIWGNIPVPPTDPTTSKRIYLKMSAPSAGLRMSGTSITLSTSAPIISLKTTSPQVTLRQF